MINERQFNQLSEMGITLYQERQKANQQEQSAHEYSSVDLGDIQQDAFFSDVLISLSLSFGDMVINDSSINLGLFDWRFHAQPTIEYHDHILVTPPLTELKKSVSLKRELWQAICKNLL